VWIFVIRRGLSYKIRIRIAYSSFWCDKELGWVIYGLRLFLPDIHEPPQNASITELIFLVWGFVGHSKSPPYPWFKHPDFDHSCEGISDLLRTTASSLVLSSQENAGLNFPFIAPGYKEHPQYMEAIHLPHLFIALQPWFIEQAARSFDEFHPLIL
jgi:hypothetical protein